VSVKEKVSVNGIAIFLLEAQDAAWRPYQDRGQERGLPPSRRAIAPLRRDGGQAASPSALSRRSGKYRNVTGISPRGSGVNARKRRAPFARAATALNT
jgi:hypothetical protein